MKDIIRSSEKLFRTLFRTLYMDKQIDIRDRGNDNNNNLTLGYKLEHSETRAYARTRRNAFALLK